MPDPVIQFSPEAIDALMELLSGDEASVSLIRVARPRDDRQNAFVVEATGNWCDFCTRSFRSTDLSSALLKATKERSLILGQLSEETEEPEDISEEEEGEE